MFKPGINVRILIFEFENMLGRRRGACRIPILVYWIRQHRRMGKASIKSI